MARSKKHRPQSCPNLRNLESEAEDNASIHSCSSSSSSSSSLRTAFTMGHPRLYNLKLLPSSDVIVKFGNYRFYAQRELLSAKSTFFHRAFEGNFPVAKSKTIDLGDEDSTANVYAMLRYLHGASYNTIRQRIALGHRLDFHIDLYLLGEQYDILSLRVDAALAFHAESILMITTTWVPRALQRILGPDSVVYADKLLRQTACMVLLDNIDILLENRWFKLTLHNDELLDRRFLLPLFIKMGERMRSFNREHRTFVGAHQAAAASVFAQQSPATVPPQGFRARLKRKASQVLTLRAFRSRTT